MTSAFHACLSELGFSVEAGFLCWFSRLTLYVVLTGSLGLSCIRPQLTAAILLLGPRSDGNRRRNFPCSAFSSTCYA